MDAASPQPPDPRIGSVLQARYRILSKIDSGAMGVVYRGERVQLGRPVAVKFLHPWIAAQKAFLSRFENEAKAMSRLLHPNCVSVIDFGIEGSPFLVMDFVTGRTLRSVMQEGRLEVPRALRIIQQLLAGLAHAHAQGIVHRDLKPENLILSTEEGLDEHLRILDFGLAKLRDGPQMTAGMAVGTPSYMSPEQSGADGAIDARTDLYTVGIVLYELLTTKKPFQSENVGELILMQREAPPPHARESVPELSKEMDGLIWKAMSKLPEDRFQSAGEMAAALEATPEAKGKGAVAAKPAGKPTGKPAGRPADKGPARPADATTVDTVSAVRRRMAEEKRPSGAVRQWRLAPVAGIFLVFAMVALLIGRLIRHSGADAPAGAAASAAPGSSSPAGHRLTRSPSSGSCARRTPRTPTSRICRRWSTSTPGGSPRRWPRRTPRSPRIPRSSPTPISSRRRCARCPATAATSGRRRSSGRSASPRCRSSARRRTAIRARRCAIEPRSSWPGAEGCGRRAAGPLLGPRAARCSSASRRGAFTATFTSFKAGKK